MPAALEDLRERLAQPPSRPDEVLPVREPLDALFPRRGLVRGSVVSVEGSLWLALAVAAAASEAGSWCAVVGMRDLGAAAAAECGIDLNRLVLVPSPGGQWATVVAALLDGFDLVLVEPSRDVRAGEARRLAARARERRSVLMPLGPAWPETVDLRLRVDDSSFSGLQRGYGRIAARHCRIASYGRGAAARERRVTTSLPQPGVPPAAVARARPLPVGGTPTSSTA
ncbi:MAG TPA: hypothetical protein VFQ85_13295 [Mycobacteriales bacterium]|jgi:hypothetical protein|nr:hypothetical protein [Mycobacteriales bacterium]